VTILPIALSLASAAGHAVPVELRVESLTEPRGIDRPQPVLSWKIKAGGPRNVFQTAYRVLVASEPSLLKEGKADLWDSGKVGSDDTYGIAYAGKPLGSTQYCWWSVETWDEAGNASGWSKPATFSTGLMKPSDWKAQWIAIDAPSKGAGAFKGASWIWQAGTPADAPMGKQTFQRRINVTNVVGIRSAIFNLTADDQFVLSINGKEVARSDGQTDAWKRPVKVDVKPFLDEGNNLISITAENTEKGAAGVVGKLSLDTGTGSPTAVVTDDQWRDESGRPVKVVGEYGINPWGRPGEMDVRPATYYRTDFNVKGGLKRATAYVTALGLVDLHLNGQRVTDDLFTPGWSDYDKRVYYRSFDVTKSLKSGANAVGAMLGDGWYSGYVGYGGRRSHYGDKPRVRVQLNLEYNNGEKETVASSENWSAGLGATTEQDFLMGETYDAQKEAVGWDKPGYLNPTWVKPYSVSDITAKVEAFPGDPVRVYDELKAKTIKEIKPGVYILDFAQNLAGFARLKVKGEPGQEIVLRYVEKLNPDGTIYTANLRGAKAIDRYICKGNGTEIWEPRFTFHGFQYIQIEGLKSKPSADTVTALAISSSTPEVGSIETSDAMINRLALNAWWTQKMNFIDIPTDCPQRDERLGWTGDAQAYIRTATTYSDVQSFFRKWLVALDDAQRADGQFPMVAPLKVAEGDGGPAWADAGVICPWTIYNVYGDERLLGEHYPQMAKFVDFCKNRSTADLLPPARFHCFGDWLSINANTPNEVIYEAYFAASARMVSQAAKVLGKTEDAAKYGKLADDVAAAFNKAYVSADGVVKGDTQCGYVLALAFDLLSPDMAKKAADRLVADIEKRGWHLSTGFVGTRDLMQVLSKIGRNDVAFRLLHNTTFPSWGFEIVNGATTIWERWDGWTPERGFQDAGMNSFAHYAYGAVMGWVFAQVGGIDYETPGFETITIAPQIDPKLTYAKTSYNSVRGVISTDWKISGDKLNLTVVIPPNIRAKIRVPVSGAGKVISDVQGTPTIESGSMTYTVGSGTYKFTSDWKQ